MTDAERIRTAASSGAKRIGASIHPLRRDSIESWVKANGTLDDPRFYPRPTPNISTKRDEEVKYTKVKKFTVGTYDGPKPIDDIDVFRSGVLAILDEIGKTVVKKQEDYGPNNIQRSPFGPIEGLTVRLYDKIARVANLSKARNSQPNYESLRDTFIDIAGYGVIGLMILDGTFPKEK